MNRKHNTTLLKKTVTFIILIIGLTLAAQEEVKEKKWFNYLTINGSIDGYFRSNLDTKNNNSSAPTTSFANQSGFALGMANVIFSYEKDNVGFVADFAYGQRGEDAVFNSDGSAQILNQLYAYWNVSKKLKLTFGNFNTYLGYEVISPTGNFNYSTSYMFSYGPFSHTGLKADFAISEKWSTMIAIMNPTDYTENNPFDTYIVGAQIGYTTDDKSAYLNFRYGNEGEPGLVEPTFQVDLTTGWDISKKLYLGVNTTYLSAKNQGDEDSSGFYGIAFYPQIKTTKTVTIGLRGEYFSVYNNGLAGVIGLDQEGDGNVIAATLTGSISIKNLILKPEVRVDATANDFFITNTGEASKNLSSILLGAIYKF